MPFDGLVGGQAWPEDDSVGPPLTELDLEEITLLQKVEEIIRTNPGKAESLFEKLHQILKEENREDLMCNHCPHVLNDLGVWDANQKSLSPSPDSGSVKMLEKRDLQLGKKEAKNKQVSKGKNLAKNKDRRNIKSEKVKNHRKTKKKEKEKKKNRQTKKASQKKKRKTKKKIKDILKMKKIRQIGEINRQRKNYKEEMKELNNNCTILWSKLTNVALGLASALQKQVVAGGY